MDQSLVLHQAQWGSLCRWSPWPSLWVTSHVLDLGLLCPRLQHWFIYAKWQC